MIPYKCLCKTLFQHTVRGESIIIEIHWKKWGGGAIFPCPLVPSVPSALKRGLAHFLSMSWSSIIWCQRIAQPPISKALPSITYAARGGAGATFCIKFHNCSVSHYLLGDFFRESLVKLTESKSQIVVWHSVDTFIWQIHL